MSVTFAEQPIYPLSFLKEKAPFQLEVTVLEMKKFKVSDGLYNIYHKVRVDDVIRGEEIVVGDVLKVRSTKRIVPLGTTGTIGDRSSFRSKGINGLPDEGDFGRIYANGTKELLTTFSPNGWQRLGKVVRFVAVDCSGALDDRVEAFANVVEMDHDIQTTTTVFHPNARTSPPIRYDREWFINSDVLVLCADCKPNQNIMDLILARVPLGLATVMMGESLCELYWAEEDRKSGPLELVIQWGGDHEIFSGVPTDAVVEVQTGNCVIVTVPESTEVLLWGVEKSSKQKIPLLWIEEKETDLQLEDQRLVGTQLTAENALQHEAVSLLLQNAIKWAGRIH